MAKINSNQVTFVDLTESRKLEIYITSSLPTTQIYNSNKHTYTPDWSVTKLQLNADVYLDSQIITPSAIKWYTKIGTVETLVGSTSSLTISTNVLSNNPIIMYICRAEYQGITTQQNITFTRVDTGSDGHSVTIGGTAYYKGVLSAAQIGQEVTLYADSSLLTLINTSQLQSGDSYIVQGYLCVYNSTTNKFICTGTIQGPKGESGDAAKSIVLSGSSQVFKVNKNNTITPTSITVTAQTINTSATKWTYSTNGGQNFLSTVPTGVSRNGNIVTITGSSITSNSIVIKASDGEIEDVFTVYKAFDGSDGTPGSQGVPAPIAFLTNENVTFSANAQGQIATTTITSNVVAYNGTTKVLPTIGTITGIPNGMTVTPSTIAVSNEIMLTITIANNSTLGSALNNMGVISIPVTSPVNTVLALTWSKVNSGTPGATGSAGVAGADAYTVTLTNESHTFVGDVSNAIAGTAETQILAYKGTTSQSVTIVSVNGKTATTTNVDTGIAGLKFKCSALSGISPTITFTCTTDFKNASGSIPIVISVDGVSFTKMFTYAIAFKGTTGNSGPAGPTGTPATSYWLVSSASVVHKTSTGTITVTPSTLTFTGKSKTGTASPTNYACRWIIAYSTDGTNYIDLHTSTADETSKSITVSTTYKTIRVRMYMAGGMTSLIDEQIIPVVVDGATGATGPRGVGVKSTTVTYGVSDSTSTKPADTAWQSTIPTVADGKYLWTRTIIDYTDDAIADTVTYTYAKQGTAGVKGDTGSSGTSITVKSVKYQSGTSATTAPTGTWSDSVVAVTEGNYLWTQTTFSDNKVAYGVARQGIDGDNGRGITSIVEQYYQSTSATTQSGGSWSATVPTWADGKYIWTRSVITYTDSTTSTTSPICITGQKGVSGIGVSSVDVWYYQSTSATALSGGSWSTTAPTWSDGKYVWTKTITTYTNSTTDETTAVCITGQKGSTGVGIKSVAEYYLATSSSSGVTTSTSGWTTTVQTITSDKKYLWNYEVVTYTDNKTSTTTPIIIGVFGNTGNTGKGISSVAERYLATTSSSGVTTSTSGWTPEIQTLTATKKYLWNYEIITYTDGTTSTINPVIIGVYGDQGTPAISVMLSNEAHLFEADAQGVPVSTSTTFDIIGYQGLAQSATTVGTITGLPSAGMTTTILNNGTTSTQIQIAVTESLTSVDSGILTIPVTVNGKVVNKKFSWTKSKEGLMGERGADAISFQVYSEDGYVLSKDTPSITLQTFAYNGDVPIEAGATYQWYKYNSGNWTAITDATNGYLNVTHSDISFSGSYMCKMLFNNIEYVGVATIDDKNDINIVFTSKPSSYAAGDIWIVGADYTPSGITTGTLLIAEHPNTTYNDADWIIATKYDKALDDIKKDIDTYNQYFDFDDEEGLRITARDKNNVESKFSTILTNERLAFNYGDNAIAYINGTSMHIKEAEIESPLTVTGRYSSGNMLQAPIINIGNFSIVVESNGSLSIVSNI